jgi:CDP-glucose 4,6-dehydratase
MFNNEFWVNKKVFITGHTGFKGSWISIWLSSIGAHVKGYSLEPLSKPNLFELAHLESILESEINDICDYEKLSKSILDFDPDILIHMAAQPLVRKSYRDPLETFNTNVIGTANVLEVAKHCKNVKAIINVTTDKCYENKELANSFKEDDPLGGHDPYSASKACAELVSSAFKNSYLKELNIGIATVRAGNVIGGGDWAEDRLVPDILRTIASNSDMCIRNPDATRPWQHVLEPLAGYILLAENLYNNPLKYSSAWNFGPEEDDIKPVSWIADQILKNFPRSNWIKDNGNHPHEASLLQLDISKSKNNLGWQPKWNIDQAIEKILEWHLLYNEKTMSVKNLCLRQIDDYVNK